MTITGIGAQTLLQAAVDVRMRGRIMALYGMIFRAGPAVGAVLMGSLSESFGLRLPLAVGALVSCGFWALEPASSKNAWPKRSRPTRRQRRPGNRRDRVASLLLRLGLQRAWRWPAGSLRRDGWSTGTCRSAGEGGSAARGGLFRCSLRPRPAGRPRALYGVTHLLVSVPPDAAGDPVLARHGDDIAALPGLCLARLSVDDRGLWRPRRRLGRRDRPAAADRRARPTSGRRRAGLARPVAATAACRSTSSASPAIYGPGRSAFDALRAGTAKRIDKPGQVFSRIHVEDLASGADRLDGAGRGPGAVYNVCDDDPAPPEAVVAHAATLLGASAAAARAARGRRALADGAQLLRRQQAGLEPPDQDRARVRACATRTSAPGSPRSWRTRLAQKRGIRHRPARRKPGPGGKARWRLTTY